MRALTLSLLFLLLSCGPLQAQRVRLGLKVGGSLSSFWGYKPQEDFVGPRGTLLAGLVAHVAWPGSRTLALQPEVLYVSQGIKADFRRPGIGYISPYRITKLRYVQVPVLLHWQRGAWGLEAGPYLGYLLQAQERVDVGVTTHTDRYRRLDVGGALGVGYQLSPAWAVGLRYVGG